MFESIVNFTVKFYLNTTFLLKVSLYCMRITQNVQKNEHFVHIKFRQDEYRN